MSALLSSFAIYPVISFLQYSGRLMRFGRAWSCWIWINPVMIGCYCVYTKLRRTISNILSTFSAPSWAAVVVYVARLATGAIPFICCSADSYLKYMFRTTQQQNRGQEHNSISQHFRKRNFCEIQDKTVVTFCLCGSVDDSNSCEKTVIRKETRSHGASSAVLEGPTAADMVIASVPFPSQQATHPLRHGRLLLG